MVTDRWILDMLPFNEWMNEADYEPTHISSGQPTPPQWIAPNNDMLLVAHLSAPATTAAPKVSFVAPAASPAAAAPKPRGRAKSQNDDAMNVDDGDDDYGTPRRGGRKRNYSEVNDGDYDEEDGAKRAKGAAVASSRGTRVNTQPRNTLQAQLVPRGPAAATKQGQARKEQLTRQTNAFVSNLSSAYALVVASSPQAVAAGGNQPSLVLPHHAEWFNINSIHEYERQALPQFFNDEPGASSKTPEIYKEYRDFMIHTYQQNPSVYLTFTACRRSLSGDALAVKAVFDFLEHTGLINYAVAPESCAVYTAPRAPGSRAPASQHLWRADPPPTLNTAPYSVFHAQPGAVTADVNMTLRKFISGTEDAKLTVYVCSKCHEVCKHMRYDYAKNSSTHSTPYVTLCKNCFASGLFPVAEMTSSDFHRVDMLVETTSAATALADASSWSEEETLKLLEGVEQFGQDWDRVASVVNTTKTADQCLAHFIRMPIEDPFTQNHALSAHQVPKLEKAVETPFSGVANPLMSMLVFLREAVSPAAAAAAAQGALKSLMATEFSRQQQLAEKQDAMDVDEKRSDDPEFLANVRAAAASALSAAALKAAVMAEREEREIQRLVHKVVDAQIKKVELKTKYFDELDRVLKDEHQKIDRARSALMQDRLTFEEQKKAALQAAETK